MIAAAKGGVAAKRGLRSCDQVRSLCQKRRVGKNINQAWKARMGIRISTANEVDGR